MSHFSNSLGVIRFICRPGNLLVTFFAVLNMILWVVIHPGNSFAPDHMVRLLGEALGSTSLIIMACIVVLAARPRALEPLFGGLDRMYLSHANFAITVLFLLNLHSLLVTTGSVEKDSVAKSLGGLALNIMLLMSIWALAPRLQQWTEAIDSYLSIHFAERYTKLKCLPACKILILLIKKNLPWLCRRYDIWRFAHKGMAIVLFLGIAHLLLIDSLMKKSAILTGYVLIWVVIAAIACLYKVAFTGRIVAGSRYVVDSILHPSPGIMELILSPLTSPVNHTSGQFLFVRFPGVKGLSWQHPFTISGTTQTNKLRLSIKASGDHTQRMHKLLQPGLEAEVEGAYGRFDYLKGGKNQIWIAGGVGITPFLSWIGSFDKSFDREIDLFYTVSRPDEFLHLDEVESAVRSHPSFRAHLNISREDGRLTVERMLEHGIILNDCDVYLCGPQAMVSDLVRQLRKRDFPEGKIHHERFTFR